MSTVLHQTNLYAREVMGEEKFMKWTRVTEEELWAYLGFSILMAVNHLPSIADYWKLDEVYHYAPIASRISRDHFLDISRFLHFVDNSTLLLRTDPNFDQLQKVRPVIDAVKKACRTVFDPSKDILVDEAMIAFKGRSSIKQYMPQKPVKRGLKVWVMADSKTGFVSQFNVYTGKKGDTSEKGLGGNVVRELVNDLLGQHRCVYMDNFFSSVPLYLELLSHDTYACGTIRANRKFFPDDLKPALKLGYSNRGEFVFRQDGNLVTTVWENTKAVSMLSTNWDPQEVVKVSRKKKDGTIIDIDCPKVVQMYNQKMGGVDRGDRYRKYYELRMKSRKVYKYIFWFLVEISMLNAYILTKYITSVGKPLLHFKDFRVKLAKLLMGNYYGRKKRGRPVLLLPAPTPKKPNLAHYPKKTKSGRCAFCPQHGKRKETTWFCEGRNLRLCHTGVTETDCFANYHVKIGIYDS